MFSGDETLEKVKKVTELYQNNTGQQDVFMHCLRDAYRMGYLQWRNNEKEVTSEEYK